jgi:hypothetical protein
LHREACLKLPCDRDLTTRGWFARLKLLLRTCASPGQVLAILRVWRDTPSLAAKLAATQRPEAKFILVGHTHFPGVWRKADGRVVINTGSFCPPRGGCFVEISKAELRVRRVVRRGNSFRAGQMLAEFPLAPAPVSPITART